MKKHCTKCKKLKNFEFFALNKRRKDGRSSWCKVCTNNTNAKWRKKNPEYFAKWYQKNSKKAKAKAKKWRLENPEQHAALGKQWRKDNPGKDPAYKQIRKAVKLRAIPKWADLKVIKKIYAKAAKLKKTVDHIVPLQSKIVSGLHCEFNLQLLSGL